MIFGRGLHVMINVLLIRDIDLDVLLKDIMTAPCCQFDVATPFPLYFLLSATFLFLISFLMFG